MELQTQLKSLGRIIWNIVDVLVAIGLLVSLRINHQEK